MSIFLTDKTAVETIDTPQREMNVMANAADVLAAWGGEWNIICNRCSRIFGLGKDQVVGDNVQGANVVVLRCGCTIRRCEVRGH